MRSAVALSSSPSDSPVDKPSSDRRQRRWLFGFFGLLTLLQLALIPVPRADNHLIGSDGIYYFAYLRSLVIEGNIDIGSEIKLYNASLPARSEVEIQMRDAPQLNYAYAIGTPMLWLPFYLVGHGLAWLLHTAGLPVALDGYTSLEEAAVCLGSLLYGCLGMRIMYGFLKRRFTSQQALLATLGSVSGTFLIYYLIFEPSMSHACSLFAASWFFSLSLEQRAKKPSGWLLGLAAGLMVLVRWQNLVLGVACLPGLLQARDWKRFAQTGLTALLVFGPQMLFWHINLGSWLTIPQGEHFMDWAHPALLKVLFTLQHGLLSWTPLVALCLLGLGLYARRARAEALICGLAFGLMWYVNAAVTIDIGGGAAFGMRRFDSCGLIFALGLAALIRACWQSARQRRLVALVILLLIGWNGLFIIQYRLHFIDPIQPLSLSELTLGKWQMLGQMGEKIRQRFQKH